MSTSCYKKCPAPRKCKSATYTWDQRTYQQHCMKIRKATPTVNMRAPEHRPHVAHDAKRVQFERERQERIARDNFILYKRLTEIMNGKFQRKYPVTQPRTSCIKAR